MILYVILFSFKHFIRDNVVHYRQQTYSLLQLCNTSKSSSLQMVHVSLYAFWPNILPLIVPDNKRSMYF